MCKTSIYIIYNYILCQFTLPHCSHRNLRLRFMNNVTSIFVLLEPAILRFRNGWVSTMDGTLYSKPGCNFSFQCNKLKKKFLFKQERDSYSSFNQASFVTFVTAKVTI